MYTLLRIDTNIIAAVFLSLVLLIASKRLDRKESVNRLFLLESLPCSGRSRFIKLPIDRLLAFYGPCFLY
jgi:hypothetical protein